MEKQFEKRLDDVQTFYGYLEDLISNFGDTREAEKCDRISKAFSERIMLAVTQVNGCRLCSYKHTKNALETGMSSEEIENLLNGELGDVPQDELVALMYGQHYAESKANPDAAATRRLIDAYGEAISRDVLGLIRAIMVGNLHGNTLDAFQQRLKRHPVPDSTLGREIGIVFGIVVFVPFIAMQQGVKKLFGRNGHKPAFS